MRLEDYPTEPRFNATVLSTERITDEGADAEVRELVLEVVPKSSAARCTTGFIRLQTRPCPWRREIRKLRSS
jgi:hypothetical protein